VLETTAPAEVDDPDSGTLPAVFGVLAAAASNSSNALENDCSASTTAESRLASSSELWIESNSEVTSRARESRTSTSRSKAAALSDSVPLT